MVLPFGFKAKWALFASPFRAMTARTSGSWAILPVSAREYLAAACSVTASSSAVLRRVSCFQSRSQVR